MTWRREAGGERGEGIFQRADGRGWEMGGRGGGGRKDVGGEGNVRLACSLYSNFDHYIHRGGRGSRGIVPTQERLALLGRVAGVWTYIGTRVDGGNTLKPCLLLFYKCDMLLVLSVILMFLAALSGRTPACLPPSVGGGKNVA